MYWLENQWQLRGCGVDCVNKVIDLTHRDTTNAGSNPARSILLNLNSMKITKSTTEKIEWDIDGITATAFIEIENANILVQNVKLSVPYSESENHFTANDFKFMKDVHKVLTDYIRHVETNIIGLREVTNKII